MKEIPILFSFFGANYFPEKTQRIIQHQFPDKEILIQINHDIKDKHVIFIANLNNPNHKLLPLIFSAETARECGARKMTLIAPYLPYMRQDKQFQPGQGITSKYFAKLISTYFDNLITIEPHLHRWHDLNEIYSIPNKVLHATDQIANWIKKNIFNPVLIGPDIESKQWVEEISKESNTPFVILEKTRQSDNIVNIILPDIELYQNHTPVLIDDIISTANTMIETVKKLKKMKMRKPTCIGVHAVFAGDAYQNLLASGVEKIVTCNTIKHVSNDIDILDQIMKNIEYFM